MKFGISLMPTDYSIAPTELAIAVEQRGFESLWFPEHSHIPTSRKSPFPGGDTRFARAQPIHARHHSASPGATAKARSNASSAAGMSPRWYRTSPSR